MSTPPVLSNAAGNCGAYKPECIGDAQKVLFYTSLRILVIGISGHLASMVSFLKLQHPEQTARPIQNIIVLIWLPTGVWLALQLINPWSFKFGIPAICTVVASFIFISGTRRYENSPPQGSPLPTLFRDYICAIPMWMTFIMCGVVTSLGNT